jgi:archaellum biogenesis ATPase FlaH
LDLKIGAGISDRFLVYYSGKSFIPIERLSYGVLMPTAAVSYYLTKQTTGVYLTGGLGGMLIPAGSAVAGGMVFGGAG